MSLKLKLVIALCLIVGAVFLSALTTQIQTAKFEQALVRLHQIHLPNIHYFQSLNQQRAALDHSLYNLRLSTDSPRVLQQKTAEFQQQIQRLAQDDDVLVSQLSQVTQSELVASLGRTREAYFDVLQSALVMTDFTPELLHAASEEYAQALMSMVYWQQQNAQLSGLQAMAATKSTRLMAWLAGLVVLALVLWLLFWSKQRVFTPLAHLSTSLHHALHQGQFAHTAPSATQQNEMAQAGRLLSQLFQQLNQFFNESNQLVKQVSQGAFDQRVSTHQAGMVYDLAVNLNLHTEQMARFCRHMQSVAQSLATGDLNADTSKQFEGQYQRIADEMARSLKHLTTWLVQMQAVMDKVTLGHLGYRVSAPVQGQFAQLKEALHQALDRLEQVVMDASRVINTQAQGELSGFIDGEYEGELSQLVDALNTNLENLDSVISTVMTKGATLFQQADNLLEHSQTAHSRIQTQAASLETHSVVMAQMTQRLQDNFKHKIKAARVARHVEHKTLQGKAVMQQAISVMRDVHLSAQKLSEMITLLDVLSFQTNVLALNAAVEAGRAGEQGRHFAKVASDVRELAQKSAEAAKDIKISVHESMNHAIQGTQLVNESATVLAEMDQASRYVSKVVSHIAATAKTHHVEFTQVHDALNDMRHLMRDNVGLLGKITEKAGHVRHQAMEQGHHIQFFKTQKSLLDLTHEEGEPSWEYSLIDAKPKSSELSHARTLHTKTGEVLEA